MKLVFATHNLNKLKEIQELVPVGIEILSLSDINCVEDIEETGSTLEENAKIKANYIKNNYGYDCFADDSGLEIEALNGAPESILRAMQVVKKVMKKTSKKYGLNLLIKKIKRLVSGPLLLPTLEVK